MSARSGGGREPAFLAEIALGPGRAARRDRRPPKRRGETVPGAAGRFSSPGAAARASEPYGPALGLLAAWRRIAGPRIACRCPVLRCSGGTLVVGVPDARWASEMTRHAARLATELARAGHPVRALRCETLADEPAAGERRAGASAVPNPAAPPVARPDPGGDGQEGTGDRRAFSARLAPLADRLLERRGRD